MQGNNDPWQLLCERGDLVAKTAESKTGIKCRRRPGQIALRQLNELLPKNKAAKLRHYLVILLEAEGRILRSRTSKTTLLD